MDKTIYTPDPIRDAPEGHGSKQSPGPYAQVPGRAVVDNRFNQYPKTFRALAVCCSFAKAWTATFWTNQYTIAEILNCSQQAASQHMNKLIEWGYIEKLRKQNQNRPFGKKGALWRIVYDPTMSIKDVEKMPQPVQAKTPEEEAKEADRVMELAARGAKGQLTKAPKVIHRKQSYPQSPQAAPCESNETEGDLIQAAPCMTTHKPHLVFNNSNNRSIEESKEEECRKICNGYSSAVAETYGRGWVYDDRQMQLASKLIDLGFTPDTFDKRSRSLIKWMRDKGKQAPVSLQYFIAIKEGKKEDPLSILKKATSKMRFR